VSHIHDIPQADSLLLTIGYSGMGFYTSVAMTLAFYDVPADAPGMARQRTARDSR
jgi:hypothetical protein